MLMFDRIGETIGDTGAGAEEALGHVALWKHDEVHGEALADDVGLQNGTYFGGVSFARPPLVAGSAGSVGYNGNDAHAQIPHNVAYEALTAYTISLLVQPDSAPSGDATRVILCKDVSFGPAGRLSIEQKDAGGTSKLRAYAGGISGAQFIGSSDGVATLAVDTAYRITLTVDPTEGTKLYLNASEVASAAEGQGWQSNFEPITVAGFRSSNGSIISRFHGSIDEVQLWQRALSAADVAALPAAITVEPGGGSASPSAANDSYGPFTAGTTQELAVLDNDANLTSRDITLHSQPSAGTVTILDDATANARLRYVLPSPAAQTPYSFTYSVDGSNVATVSVLVNGTSGVAPSFYINNNATQNYDHGGYPAYNAANPKAATFTPSPWGCKMCRLTGSPGTNILVDGTTDTGLDFEFTHGHGAYSTMGQDCFNADGSLFLLGIPTSHGGRRMLLDGNTFHIRRVQGFGPKDISGPAFDNGFWHPTNPNLYIDLAGSGQIQVRQWNVSAASGATNMTVLRTITGYSGASFAGQNKFCSRDASFIGIRADRQSDGQRVYFAYNIATGTKSGDRITAPDGGPYESLSISPSGQYYICGLGPWEGIPGGRVFDVWEFPNTFIGERRTAQIKHKTPYFDGVDDWRVGAGAATVSGVHNNNDAVAVRLRDGFIRRLTSTGNFDYMGGSFDGRYIYGTSTSVGSLGREIVAIRADGAPLNTWRRLGPHNSIVNNIRDQPDPVGSRNGDMVIFDTNWMHNNSGGSGHRFPMMIYDLISQKGWSNEPN